jgi:hypothetical protein
MSWVKIPKIFKRLWCDHIDRTTHLKYNLSAFKVTKVEAIDGDTIFDGGTLVYYKECSRCGKKEHLVHHITPRR